MSKSRDAPLNFSTPDCDHHAASSELEAMLEEVEEDEDDVDEDVDAGNEDDEGENDVHGWACRKFFTVAALQHTWV